MNYSRHISLPKLWLANNNLEDGGVVDLFLGDGNDLIIRPEERKEGDSE
ncbi:MAG: AbrB/MazE/SpoVT family DNA-binding domain-containing protein [Proteobacteria bacterium]|nr:AbrB/MazE/SpoVT family DNA-binding domain-containing protein [Pseudomonadota bacterium]